MSANDSVDMTRTFQLPAGPGRRYSPDERDLAHPARKAIPVREQMTDDQATAVQRGWRYWNNVQARLHQGRTGTCVGHAWTHLRENGPWTYPGTADAFTFYRQAVLLDEWTENDHEANAPVEQLQFGTSVRAGAKVGQNEGWIGEYLWAMEMQELIDWLLKNGPVVVGTWWYRGMTPERVTFRDEPDQPFLVPAGDRVGGHSYQMDGIHVGDEKVRCLNSWRGLEIFWLSFSDVERLLFAENGEACMSIELGGR